MDNPVYNVNVDPTIAALLTDIFRDIRFSHTEYKIVAVDYPGVRADTPLPLYTDDIAGKTLATWDVRCEFNRYGNYHRVAIKHDDRKKPEFVTAVRNLASLRQYTFTGSLLYQAGFMSWHTNHDPGLLGSGLRDIRVYVTHNCDDGSVFKYIDPVDGVVKAITEPAGWSIKLFDVTDPLWHCIISGAQRMSVGTRFIVAP